VCPLALEVGVPGNGHTLCETKLKLTYWLWLKKPAFFVTLQHKVR
jgi:hypothetical protein